MPRNPRTQSPPAPDPSKSSSPCFLLSESSGSTSLGGTALPLAPRNLGLQGIQLVLPEPPELIDPAIGFLERLRIDGVQPPLRVHANRGEPGLPQDLQMLRHRGLG